MISDIISGIVLIIFSIYIYYLTLNFPTQKGTLGPASFPRILVILIAILSLIMILQSLKRKDAKIQESIEDKRGILFVILFIILFIAYSFLMNFLGFFLSSILFLFITSILLDKKNFLVKIIFSVVTSILIFYVFKTILKVSLPVGFLNI